MSKTIRPMTISTGKPAPKAVCNASRTTNAARSTASAVFIVAATRHGFHFVLMAEPFVKNNLDNAFLSVTDANPARTLESAAST